MVIATTIFNMIGSFYPILATESCLVAPAQRCWLNTKCTAFALGSVFLLLQLLQLKLDVQLPR